MNKPAGRGERDEWERERARESYIIYTYLDGGVGERGALRRVGTEAALRHIEGFGGVVEGPLEVLWRRKSIHFANDFGRFAASNAIDFLLIGPANWFICVREERKIKRDREREKLETFDISSAFCCSQLLLQLQINNRIARANLMQ